MRRKTVAIIHFNTPEMTRAVIMSARKHGGQGWRVVVFDNSDKRPFAVMPGVEVIDNTRGQVIDFEKELAKFPDREPSIGCGPGCEYGSAKHMMTVQKLWELLPDGFVLLESDVLLKHDINDLWREDYAVVGYRQEAQPRNPYGIGRMMPMLCYMNVPVLQKAGARYFDPARTYGLLKGRNRKDNWYDTGSVLLEDVLRMKPALRGHHYDIRPWIEHYGSGSWQRNDVENQQRWIDDHRDLWAMPEGVAVCAIGRMENRYAVEWVEHYNALGVDKIIIYDNNRIEDGEMFQDVLYPYIEAGFVEVIPFEGVQREAYEDCYQRFGKDFAWIGFFDFDEFVEIDDGKDIPTFLSDKQGDAVVMNWRTMTDNGLTTYDPRPVKERFTEGTSEDFDINRHTKFFIRTGMEGVAIQDPHCPTRPEMVVVNARNEIVNQQPIQDGCIHHPARVDHYDTKTADEYINVKWKRGTCCGDAWTEMKRKTCVEYFFSINKRTKAKEAILAGKPIETKAKKADGKPATRKRKTNKKE